MNYKIQLVLHITPVNNIGKQAILVRDESFPFIPFSGLQLKIKNIFYTINNPCYDVSLNCFKSYRNITDNYNLKRKVKKYKENGWKELGQREANKILKYWNLREYMENK